MYHIVLLLLGVSVQIASLFLQVSSVFQKYEELIESLHISDQYTGVVDDTAEDESGAVIVKIPERKIIFTYTGEPVILVATSITVSHFAAAPRAARHGHMKSLEPLLRFVMQLIDRVNKYKLSKEVCLHRSTSNYLCMM